MHLSAISAPADAGADPRLAWEVNTLGTRAVAEAIVRLAPDCRLIFASTGLVYGAAATVPNVNTTTLTADQRGVTRDLTFLPNLGAYQAMAPTLTVAGLVDADAV